MRGGATARAVAAALLATAACRTAGRGVPAVIVEPTEESRTALVSAVAAALHGAPVRLADDALTRSSMLTVERVRPRDSTGLPIVGRDLGTPERFRLVKRGAGCFLVHERTGREIRLEATRCAAAAEPRLP
jgi:hypothetical protein